MKPAGPLNKAAAVETQSTDSLSGMAHMYNNPSLHVPKQPPKIYKFLTCTLTSGQGKD